MNNVSDNDCWPLDGGCNSGFDMNWSGRGQGSGYGYGAGPGYYGGPGW